MIVPTLLELGTEEQKRRWIAPTLRGEIVWCQGYSEPGAGSDLAALRTRAREENGEFVINGQKIWTTLAQDATHIFLLVRTDKAAKKQEGISFLLADMKSPGVTVRPLRHITGEIDFNEVFLDEVRVPGSALVVEDSEGTRLRRAHARVLARRSSVRLRNSPVKCWAIPI